MWVSLYVCVSGGKKCSFFGIFDVICFFFTSVLTFALLLYYQCFVTCYLNFILSFYFISKHVTIGSSLNNVVDEIFLKGKYQVIGILQQVIVSHLKFYGINRYCEVNIYYYITIKEKYSNISPCLPQKMKILIHLLVV